jgi:hypothetical protein
MRVSTTCSTGQAHSLERCPSLHLWVAPVCCKADRPPLLSALHVVAVQLIPCIPSMRDYGACLLAGIDAKEGVSGMCYGLRRGPSLCSSDGIHGSSAWRDTGAALGELSRRRIVRGPVDLEWKGHGPKTRKGRAPVPVIRQLAKRLGMNRLRSGKPGKGPIFADGRGIRLL